MRMLAFAIAVLVGGAFAAFADGKIDLKKPEPDAFGNEPSTAITPKPQLLINKATEAELIGRQEVGSLYAKRVIEARPYVGVEDFRTRSGLPSENVDKIKDLLDF